MVAATMGEVVAAGNTNRSQASERAVELVDEVVGLVAIAVMETQKGRR